MAEKENSLAATFASRAGKALRVALHATPVIAGGLFLAYPPALQHFGEKFPKHDPTLLSDSATPHTVENTALDYLTYGDSENPWVILIHGSPGGASLFDDLSVELSEPPNSELKGHFVIAVNRAGYGEDNSKDPECSVEAHADNLKTVLDDAQIKNKMSHGSAEKSITLFGHSYGGPVALWFAADNPEIKTNLVLSGSGADPSFNWFALNDPTGRIAMKWALGTNLQREYANKLGHAHLTASYVEMNCLQSGLGELAPRLTGIDASAIILNGKNDLVVPVRHGNFLHDQLPNSTLITDFEDTNGKELKGMDAHRLYSLPFAINPVLEAIRSFSPASP